MDNITGQNTYFYKEPAWHKKGYVSEVEMGAVEALQTMPDTISFDKRPFGVMLNGEFTMTDKHYAIVKVWGDAEEIIGTTKDRYELVQPLEYAELFDTYVNKPVETLGFLGSKGQRMFLTWNLPTINVKGDIVKTFGFLPVGFDGTFGEQLYVTKVRVVCANTWRAAVNEAEANKNYGRGAVYNGKHTHKDHMEKLGVWMRYMTQQADRDIALYQALYTKMEETNITKSTAYDLFRNVYPLKSQVGDYYPDEYREKDNQTINDYNQSQTESVDLAMSLFSGAGIEISKTVWGAFNSVTEAENHRKPSKKDTTESILVGNRAGIMDRALKIMREYVEVR